MCENCSDITQTALSRLDKLAQDGTSTGKTAPNQPKSQKEYFYKKAKKKYITLKMVKALAGLGSSLQHSYENSFKCQNEIKIANGQTSTNYCKNRWCLTCANIRTGSLINKYGEYLKKEFLSPYFVTLTAKNISGNFLKDELKKFRKILTTITSTARKRWQRGGKKFKAIANLECTYNASRQDFNPHFHILVDTEEHAKELVERWLELCEKNGIIASPKAQNIQKVRGPKALLEVFKYSAKVLSENTEKKKIINIKALDLIYCCFKGMRLLTTYGIKITAEEIEEIEYISEEVNAPDGRYLYVESVYTWINIDTGEFAYNYIPDQLTQNLIYLIE